MTDCLSRRDALKTLMTTAGAIGAPALLQAAAASTAAAEKPRLSPKDPTAVALAYFEDATKVDPKVYTNWKAGQLCSNCLQGTGAAADVWRGCNLFPGKLVASAGWCKVYIKKP